MVRGIEGVERVGEHSTHRIEGHGTHEQVGEGVDEEPPGQANIPARKRLAALEPWLE